MEVPTVSVKDMLPFQRPREKFLALGPSHMAMEESCWLFYYVQG